jgi:hypothetical protein
MLDLRAEIRQSPVDCPDLEMFVGVAKKPQAPAHRREHRRAAGVAAAVRQLLVQPLIKRRHLKNKADARSQTDRRGHLTGDRPMFLNDPQRWRDRADEMRSLASEINDQESRRIMLRLANDYELLARRRERLAQDLQASKLTA